MLSKDQMVESIFVYLWIYNEVEVTYEEATWRCKVARREAARGALVQRSWSALARSQK